MAYMEWNKGNLHQARADYVMHTFGPVLLKIRPALLGFGIQIIHVCSNLGFHQRATRRNYSLVRHNATVGLNLRPAAR